MHSYNRQTKKRGGKGPFQMRGLWTGLVLLLAACSGGQPEDFSVKPADDPMESTLATYDVGKSHFAAGRYGLAIKSFQSDLQRFPDSIKTLNAVAASYDRIGRFDLADRYYERAVNLNPDSVQTANNMGYSWLLRGDREKAQQYFQLAQSLEPSNGVVGANLAKLAGEQPAATQVATVEAPRTLWIERKSEHVQYLVISPSREILEQIRSYDVDPQLVAYSPAVEASESEAVAVASAVDEPESLSHVADAPQDRVHALDAIKFVPGLAGMSSPRVKRAQIASVAPIDVWERESEQLAAADPHRHPM